MLEYRKVWMLLVLFAIALPAGAVTFLEDFTVPENASGLAHDGDALWLGHVGTNGEEIWKLADHDGEVLDTIPAPADGCYGLTIQGSLFWFLNSQPENRMYSIDPTGTVIRNWAVPTTQMSGVAVHGSYVYAGSYNDPSSIIFILDPVSGDSTGYIPAPDNHPTAMAAMGESIWVAGLDSDMVYRVDPETGEVLESFASPGQDPRGLAYDGRWLYLLDDAGTDEYDRVYRIEPLQPEPNAFITPREFYFGAVEVGHSATIEITITNVGSAPLEVNTIQFSGNPTGFAYDDGGAPFTLGIFESGSFSLTFEPPVLGIYDLPYMYLTCNDPDTGYYEFPVFGIGGYTYPTLNIVTTEDPIEFGTVQVQQTDGMSLQYLVFSNFGVPDLRITDFESSSEDFFVTRPLPFTVEGGHYDSLGIWWRPTEIGFINETVTMTTNAQNMQSYNVGVTGIAQEYTINAGTRLWEYQQPAPTYYDGFNFNGELSDIADLGYNAVFAITGKGDFLALNSNSWDDGHVIYRGTVDIPTVSTTGFNNRTGYLNDSRTAAIANDLNGDGMRDILVGTGGPPLDGSMEAGVLLALDGTDGSLIWMFDTAVYGGAPFREVITTPDFTGDGVEDVAIALDKNHDLAGPKAVALLDGTNGYPIWLSAVRGDFRRVAVGDDSNGDGILEFFCGTGEDGNIYALDGATGYPIWSFDAGSGTRDIVPIDNVVGDATADVMICANSGTYVLDGSNGEEFWHINYLNQVVETQNLGDVFNRGRDLVAIAMSAGQAMGIDTYDGEEVWTLNVNGVVLDMQYVTDESGDGIPELVIGTDAGRIAVLEGSGLRVQWSYTEAGTNRNVNSVAMVRDVEGNYSAELIGCSNSGSVRLFSGGNEASSVFGEPTGPEIPSSWAVSAAYPNPFNSIVRLQFVTPATGQVAVGVYDLMGRMVDQISLQPQAGQANALWNPSRSLASGMYIICIEQAPEANARVFYVK